MRRIWPIAVLITWIVHEEMLPTKHTKHTDEAESAWSSFRGFCVFSGQTPITEDRGGKSPSKKKSSQSAMNLAYNVTDNTDGAKRFGLRRCCARFKRENHGFIFGLWHSFVIPHSDFVISEHPCHPCDPWLSPLLSLRVYSSGSCRIRG
jgi:hypothetical protein